MINRKLKIVVTLAFSLAFFLNFGAAADGDSDDGGSSGSFPPIPCNTCETAKDAADAAFDAGMPFGDETQVINYTN